ncbi:MAG: dihydrofolate reductase family protein [Anaerolineales bacterium]|jgi:2,5-diamino-6-hydroxy-4-(5-phosphoribosylamino)pyrimidine 1'-reductase|nr:dihydrofolate reductase family protein [Anaerolineales bacterium]
MQPYVIINAAMSLDGKIDTFERRGAQISSAEDKRRVLELRASVDAVLVGGNTLNNENPKLTVKLPELAQQRLAAGLPANPAKVGIVTRAALDPNGDFIQAGPARRIVFTTPKTEPAQREMLAAAGVEILLHDAPRVDLGLALQTLNALGMNRIMVEGGGTLIAEFVRLGLADELQLYLAPKLFGGVNAPSLVAGDGWPASEVKTLALVEARVLDAAGGLLLCYHLQK